MILQFNYVIPGKDSVTCWGVSMKIREFEGLDEYDRNENEFFIQQE